MEALLSVESVSPVGRIDVYVGAILPDGRFVSWVGDPQAPALVTGTLPIPFLADVLPAETTAFRVGHKFVPGDPHGWYLLYGLIVPVGAAPFDPRGWISASFFPLLVHPGQCPVC